MDVVLIVGIIVSFFQFILLLNKKAKSLPDLVLTVWMLIIAVHLISYNLYYHGYWEVYPHLIGTTAPLPLVYGPLLYFYVSYSLKNHTRIQPKHYWHFFPLAAAYAYMCKFYFFYSGEEKRLVDNSQIHDFDLFSTILLISIIVSGILYSIISYSLLKKHQVLIENNFSNTEKINLKWLQSFIIAVGAVFLGVIFVIIFRDIIKINFFFNPEIIFYSILVIAILLLGYYGIRNENIFVDNEIVQFKHTTKSTYQKSGLKEDVASKKYEELIELMKNSKPYLDPKLSLSKLSELLNISPNHLSQIINQYESRNFNDFVNHFRIAEFIERASHDTHLSFLALALESGFNSKSTFNTVFKKQKGETPSKYMNSIPKM